MQDPAQKILVHKFIDWQKVEDRLARYKNIGSHYNKEDFQKSKDKGPYYCHYLAWRLGTWNNEKFFESFDHLLYIGATLKNWNSSENLLKSPSFDVFWGLLWQLQIANFFSNMPGVELEWLPSGPDLKISHQGECFFVECYTYRKSFGIEEFINELLRHIHGRLRTHRVPYTPFALPQNSETNNFLDKLFTPFLDPQFIQDKSDEAQKKYPIILPVPEGVNNFYIRMDGDDPKNYEPERLPNSCGCPDKYLQLAIREGTTGAKENSNKLKDRHPNILAVNFLLGNDFESAFKRHTQLRIPTIPLDFGEALDGVLLTVCGIDETLTLGKTILDLKSNHPIKRLLPPA